jgi:hypothetical protein
MFYCGTALMMMFGGFSYASRVVMETGTVLLLVVVGEYLKINVHR